ncbi:ATPase P [Clostridium sp.]|uniref:HAD family hydrolase n=1 Tax=Clostridium sp. TaxID=1506 RepID=UPI0032171004
MEIKIPGREELNIENILLDYNGTIALDGIILSEVKARIIKISNLGFNIYVLTADTHGTVKNQCEGLPLEIKIFDNSSARKNKEAIVEELGGSSCIAIGNGFNDGLMFEKSALGIIVLGNEGCSAKSLMKAEIVCKSIEDALDLILKKDRLVATLRG